MTARDTILLALTCYYRGNSDPRGTAMQVLDGYDAARRKELLAERTDVRDRMLRDAHAAGRTEALAEAKDEVVEWLVKKAHEGTEVSRLADKVERGAIRLFFDAEQAAAAPVAQHYDKVPDPLDGCHWCACGNRWPCKGDGAVTG